MTEVDLFGHTMLFIKDWLYSFIGRDGFFDIITAAMYEEITERLGDE